MSGMQLSRTAARERLDSWKQIAAFFGRDERTVKRWEKERGLPVHRMPGGTRSGVFAYTRELSEWLKAPSALEAPANPQSVSAAVPTMIVSNARKTSLWRLSALLACVAAAAVIGTIAHRRNADSQLELALSRAGAPSATANPEAKDLYLKGRYYWNKRTGDALTKAIDYFTQAVVRDPNYAQAYAGLADSYNLLREYTAVPDSEAYPKAIAAAKRALQLDERLPEAHAALAFASFWGAWDLNLGVREFRRAIALNPSYVAAHHWYATALTVLGRFPESLQEIERARELDPTSNAIIADKALILYYSGEHEPASGLFKQLEATEPSFVSSHRYLAVIALWDRDYITYLSEARQTAVLLHDPGRLAIVEAASKGWRTGGARGLLQGMRSAEEKLYSEGQLTAYSVASTCAQLGDRRAALRYLATSYQKHESAILTIAIDRDFEKLHDDPAYRELVHRILPSPG
jgi:tetratricopeptide (TPR) repeat protein